MIYKIDRSIHLTFLYNHTVKMKESALFTNIGEFGDKYRQNTMKAHKK